MDVVHNLTPTLFQPIEQAYSFSPFGCCGARYVDNPVDFNNPAEVPLKDHWNTELLFAHFNRGILLGRNIEEKDVVQSDNSVVESFTVGGETFFVRIRK